MRGQLKHCDCGAVEAKQVGGQKRRAAWQKPSSKVSPTRNDMSSAFEHGSSTDCQNSSSRCKLMSKGITHPYGGQLSKLQELGRKWWEKKRTEKTGRSWNQVSYLKGNASHCRFTGRDLTMKDFRDVNLEMPLERLITNKNLLSDLSWMRREITS